MDRYDPRKRVGLIVDEWGAWYKVEPGTNPGFLYQQNTLRDALVAGINLNIFNAHCDRVRMANLAQTVNVLQALVLTDKEKMVVTPTYHVFDMYKVHQEAVLLPLDLKCRDYVMGEEKIPCLSVSASSDGQDKIHITLCNLDPYKSVPLICDIRGVNPQVIAGDILTASEMNAHNTFENPEAVKPEAFFNARLNNGKIEAILPPKSIVSLQIIIFSE